MTDKQQTNLPVPLVASRPFSRKIHGITLSDPYSWLRDAAWSPSLTFKPAQEIMNYINEENNLTNSFMEDSKELMGAYIDERKKLIPHEDMSVPIKKDGFCYYTRQSKDQNYPIYCRKEHNDQENDQNNERGKEHIYFDQNEHSQGHSFYKIGQVLSAPNHTIFAYSLDLAGNEYYTLKIKNFTGEELTDTVTNISPHFVWAPDSSGFFYCELSKDQWRKKYVKFHKLGTSVSEDILLYEEKDLAAHMEIDRSNDYAYLFIQSATKDDDEIYAYCFEKGDYTIHKIVQRKPKRHVDIEHKNGFFYFNTNEVGENFGLLKVATTEAGEEKWQTVLPYDSSRYITGFFVYEKGILVSGRENGLQYLSLLDEDKQTLTDIPMTDPTYSASFHLLPYTSNVIRFAYSSLSKPPQIIELDFKLKNPLIKKDQAAQCGFNTTAYKTERVFILSRDGQTQIPVSLVYRKDLFKGNGQNPLYLYGYGAYGYSLSPSFTEGALPYVDRGFVYAIAHVRGGAEMGYAWYLDGKMEKKWNTFHDFIDCAQGLIDRRYTTAGKIVAGGGSAGGLLMGVIANEAPSLFGAIIADVPFVDVMNTMLDETLPLTVGEFIEWGNPSDNEDVFKTILSYSPYDNVKSQAYPALFITGGLTDPRVTYWEPLKWIAKLRAHHTGDSLILLDMNTDAGHGGATGRTERLKEAAKSFAFIMKNMMG